MSSYFDLKPVVDKTSRAGALGKDGGHFEDPDADEGKMTLLTPTVSRILDDMDMDTSDEELSDSSSDADDESEEQPRGRGKRRDSLQESKQKEKSEDLMKKKEAQKPKPHPLKISSTQADSDSLSPTQANAQARLQAKPKQPHMARFHSLRSMLFSSHLAEQEAKYKAEQESKDADGTAKPADQPDQQRTKPTLSTKNSFTDRLTNKLKKMGSRDSDLPTLKEKKKEEEESEEEDKQKVPKIKLHAELEGSDSETEGLEDDDVHDLIRYVSRRDRPGGAPQGEETTIKAVDLSGSSDSVNEIAAPEEDGLNQEDVDDLVKWVSRK